MSRKKILFMINHLDIGGVERAVVDIVNGLNKDKYEITLMPLFKYKPHMYEIDHSVKVKKVFGVYFPGFTKILQRLPAKLLYKIFVKQCYDYEVAFQAGAPTYILSGSTNPYAVRYSWVHGLDMTNPKANDTYDKIVFCGEAVKTHYAHYFKNKDKLIVQYNPLQCKKIKQLAEEKISLDSDKNILALCSVGRLSEEKGYLRLIETIKKLKTAGQDLRLWIVGDGHMKSVLAEAIHKNKLEKEVLLVGYQKNPYKYIKAADAYICSSFNEGFNISATEAMLLEKPILTTDVFGMSELIGGSDCGIITENSEEGLFNGIFQLLNDKKLCEMKTAAKIRAQAFFERDPIKELEKLFI